MEGETRMSIEPFADLRVLVDRIVIEDDVDGPVGGDLSLDPVEEADELRMPMLCMQRPMTLPSRTSKAANRVVVPLRL